MKKIRISGGPAVPLVAIDGELRGATWGPDDTIILATTSPVTGLQRLNAADGTLSTITKPASSKGEYDHLWPELLPDGRAVLFTITAAAELDTITATGSETAQVAVRDLQTDLTTVLLPGATHARYAPTGQLIFAAAGEIRAIPFESCEPQGGRHCHDGDSRPPPEPVGLAQRSRRSERLARIHRRGRHTAREADAGLGRPRRT